MLITYANEDISNLEKDQLLNRIIYIYNQLLQHLNTEEKTNHSALSQFISAPDITAAAYEEYLISLAENPLVSVKKFINKINPLRIFKDKFDNEKLMILSSINKIKKFIQEAMDLLESNLEESNIISILSNINEELLFMNGTLLSLGLASEYNQNKLEYLSDKIKFIKNKFKNLPTTQKERAIEESIRNTIRRSF